MNILALDTCTEACSAALLYQGQVIERVEITQRGHSDLILGMMESLFKEAGTDITTVDAIAFGRGPGSFTGVRVGTGVVQGIAFARELPVIPISSLAALAQDAADTLDVDNLAVAMDARMGEVYSCHYQRQAGLVVALDDERVCPPEQVTPPAISDDWYGVGTGWGSYDNILRETFQNQLSAISVEQYPKASAIIKLAEVEAKAGRMVTAEQALPVYLRNNVAKKKGEQ